MDHNQRTSKSRPQDPHKPAKKPDDSQQRPRQGMSGTQISVVPTAAIGGASDIQFVSTEFLQRKFGTVAAASSQKAGSPLSTNAVPAQVKIARGGGADLYRSGVPGQVMVLKADKEGTLSPLGDPPPAPPHTTKSSSLSRDISPSRITAQVAQVMSESTDQPLLLSALTGKMPAPLITVGTNKHGAAQELRHSKQAEGSNLRTSPYSMADERNSPVQVDSRGQGESKMRSMPFEKLMWAAALVQAQELQGGSSPSRQQQTMQQLASGNHTDSRNQTPSPKPVTPSRSPQRQQHQQRSPVGAATRTSPVPPSTQEALSAISAAMTMSGGVVVQMPHMGLVQQHLLSGTLASSTRASSPHTKSGGMSSLSGGPPHPAIPVPSVLSTSSTTLQKPPAKGARNSHVSIGTGTDVKQYSSHGAQTKHVSSSVGEALAKSKQGEAGQGSQGRDRGQHHDSGVAAAAVSVGVSGDKMRAVSPAAKAVGLSSSSVGSYPSSVLAAGRPLTSSASMGELSGRGHHSSVATSAHGNKPIPVPSSHSHSHHAHSHPHHPHPQPKPQHIPVTSASQVSASVNHVSAATVSQTQVSSSRPHSTPSSRVHHPAAVHVKQEPRAALPTLSSSSSSSSHTTSTTVSSANYQPHHHHYHHLSQPAQTITSQTVREAGPVVKDFIPVVRSPEPPPPPPPPPPPYQQQPPLPPHVNPFTFPTSAIKIHFPASRGEGSGYSLPDQRKDAGAKTSDRAAESKGFDRVEPSRGFDQTETKTFEPEAKVFEQVEAKVFGRTESSPFSGKSQSDGASRQQKRRFPLLEGSLEGKQDMPRLTAEGLYQAKSEAKHGAFNHVGHLKVDGKEQLLSPFNMRLQNLNNFPSMATAYRSAYRSHSVALQRAKAGSITSAAKSLDLLRQNVQKNINKELHGIVQRYVEKFFRPAADNIRLNNGLNSVSEEHLNAVCRQVFEEAKRMYTTEARRCATPVGDFPDNVSESGSINGRRVSPIPSLISKRPKASDSDSEKGSDNGIPKKIPRRKGRPPLNSSGRSTPVKPTPKECSIKREGPKVTSHGWNPDRIKPETLFVMGARANKALGLGNTRGRLYIRHPDVFKYSGDQEDKIWLHEQKLMPATGGKAYMLLVEDIIDLSKSDEYRDSPMLLMHECRGFEVPDWMQIKIKAQMQSQRSDLFKENRSRSRSPVHERPEPPKTLPFSNFSDTTSNNDIDSVGNKNSLQPSPADTEEMEFLSAVENDDTQPSDISPFNVTGGFDDTPSRSPCRQDSVDSDQALTTPFT